MSKQRYVSGALIWFIGGVTLLATGLSRGWGAYMLLGAFVWLFAFYPRGGWME